MKPHNKITAVFAVGFSLVAWLAVHGRMLAAVTVLVVTVNIAGIITDLAKDEEERKQ